MTQTDKDLINRFNFCFYYSEGRLYWNPNMRLANKEAGYADPSGYIQVRVGIGNGKHRLFLVHRVIFAMHNGYLPELVDHVDRNPANNLISNLRDASKTLNTINTGIPSNNSSGIKGVSWHAKAQKWSAQIKVSGKKIHLGTFKLIEDARTARKTAENLYWNDL